MTEREKLIQYAVKYHGDWNKIAAAAARKEKVIQIQSVSNCLTILDEEYPVCLRELRYPPLVLFYRGNIDLLKRPMITIVGSRNLGAYGKNVTEACADALADRFVLVSGLARGADAAVHRTALQKGHTIGVIGCGINRIYPYENKELYARMAETDLILSEYPADVAPEKHHFPWRNRILAALGESIIVTQASLHSGTMLTVNEGVHLGRDIWCIPYSLDEKNGDGCNRLIAEGAGILYDLSILKDFYPGRMKY